MLKQLVMRMLSPTQVASLYNATHSFRARLCGGDLKQLARLYGSDKWGEHWYAQHYERHFLPLRTKRLNILEIGIGGGAATNAGGASLRMWTSFFPNSSINGIDLYDKSFLQSDRVKVFQGSQDDPDFLEHVIKEIGSPDIIIDDGSHRNEHVIKTFQILFPRLSDTGIYVIEDTQTSYWPEEGGSSDDLNASYTTMGLLKGTIDGLNHAEFIRPGYLPSYFDEHIVSMHFYHNLVFIYKGDNDEGSNRVKNNKTRRK